MTYQAPELLLVGAAQNLVLETSDIPSKSCGVEDVSPFQYNPGPGW